MTIFSKVARKCIWCCGRVQRHITEGRNENLYIKSRWHFMTSNWFSGFYMFPSILNITKMFEFINRYIFLILRRNICVQEKIHPGDLTFLNVADGWKKISAKYLLRKINNIREQVPVLTNVRWVWVMAVFYPVSSVVAILIQMETSRKPNVNFSGYRDPLQWFHASV